MYCIHCGHHQREGKFCASCGTVIGDRLAGVMETRAVKLKPQSSGYAKKMQALSTQYWRYVVKYLKRPVEIFEAGEKEFSHGLVTIGLLTIVAGLAKDLESPSLLAIGGAIAYAILAMMIVLGSLYITVLFVGPEQSIKKLVSIYGTHLISSIILVVIAYLLLLLKVTTIGNLLLLFALLFTLLLVPLYILTKLLKQDTSIIDPLYSLVVYVVIFGIISSVCYVVFGNR
ncbi:hypothetical protein [Sporosarcina sp. YIM B06819]|uniref:hypothetical protein n=1 Tax=Sporosarcina sp. YIM B06819 TaxID=3081769 RepID=UPI00298D4F1B|nr:hypothetical protein [Sporosarcina sp. YIM B06819]